jgi:DNA-binding XRE family transcriptional regulator
MAVKSNAGSPVPPKTFATALLELVWRNRYTLIECEQDEYPDIRTAAFALRTATGLSQEQLAGRIGIMPNQLALIERRGHPIDMKNIERMKTIAWEYSLYKMYLYFDKQALLFRETMRKRRPKQHAQSH